MLIGLLVVGLVLAGSGVGVRLFMDRAAENRLLPGEAVAIGELRDPIAGNASLACPPSYCQATAAPSPVFPLSAERLGQLWVEVLADEPHVVIVEDDAARRRMVAIQHTPLLRFPDVVAAEFVPLGADRSSIAVYSRARYGKGDFGVNHRRVTAWLARLAALASAVQ